MEPSDRFKAKIDYDNSLTSVACSIQKYFDLPQRHKTLPEIDKLFEEKKTRKCHIITLRWTWFQSLGPDIKKR